MAAQSGTWTLSTTLIQVRTLERATLKTFDFRLSTFDLTLPRPFTIIQYRPAVKEHGKAEDGQNLEADIGQAAAF